MKSLGSVALVLLVALGLASGAAADPVGQITELSGGLHASSAPFGIAPGPDGEVWFTDQGNPKAASHARSHGRAVLLQASKLIDKRQELMPVVNLRVMENVLSPQQKHKIAEQFTETLVSVIGEPEAGGRRLLGAEKV